MRRFILFLVRLRLGVRKYERFQFTNQKSTKDFYYFNDDKLMKREHNASTGMFVLKFAQVSLNWMLDPECKVATEFGDM